MKNILLLIVLGFALSTSTRTHAQEAPVIGKRSKVTISLGIQQTVGAHLVSSAKIQADAAKGITYEQAVNPWNYISPENGAQYYATKRQRVARGEGANAEVVTTITTSYTTVAQRYGNRDFLAELALVGAFPGIVVTTMQDALFATRSFGLVAVRWASASTLGRFTYFLVERPAQSPVFVGYYNEIAQTVEQQAYGGPIYLRMAQSLGDVDDRFRTAGTEKTTFQYRTREVGGVDVDATSLINSSEYLWRVELQLFPEYQGGGGYRYLIGAGQLQNKEAERTSRGVRDSARSSFFMTGFIGGYRDFLVKGGLTASSEQIGVDISAYRAAVPELLR